MKPTTSNGNDNLPSKGSLTKSMKKSSKSRSKLSKVATSSIQASLQQTTNAQEAATPTTIQDLPKEKAHHRSYAGFGSKSIKIIWEQHDTSDTEIMPDVYSRLAEDVTYKVWELVNNIKTYARHSGGRVTVDLVNEVLKDSDVPPVLGASDTEWDKIEYDGNFFFNSDHILELRDEYLKENESTVICDTDIISTWSADRKESKTYLEFVSSLSNALFLGDDEAYNYALDIAKSAPQIGCTLKLFLKKCIEMLAFEQKPETIERCLEFLKSLSMNSYTRDIECREQLYHLCEILMCLLMGTYDSIKPPIKSEKKEELSSSFSTSLIEEILNESLSQHEKTELCENGSSSHTFIRVKKEEETTTMFSPYQAEMCDYKMIDLIASTLGYMSNQFGYFRNECTFLMQQRMEKFFNYRQAIYDEDFKFISRCVRGLLALGEYAFREILPFLCKIDPQRAPETIRNDFSPAAIFLKGRDDIFLYEWLEELCGIKLQPFNTYAYKYHQKLATKFFQMYKQPTYKISPKICIKCYENEVVYNDKIIDKYFPDIQNTIKKSTKIINFKYVGCRPINIKPKSIKNTDVIVTSRIIHNSKIVLGKRKLLKTLTDKKKVVNLSNYCYLQI